MKTVSQNMDEPLLVKFGGWVLAVLAAIVAFFSRRQLFDIQKGIAENHTAIVAMNEKLARMDERLKNLEGREHD